MEAIILAGGLGTRLASRLNGVPKPMVPVAGRPFLEILLSRLRRGGCTRVLLSVGHLHAAIQHHFGTVFDGIPLDYVIEDTPLGTGGALRKAMGQTTEQTVLVLNGDTFLEVDYAAMLNFHKDQAARLTLAVTKQADIARYGEVVLAQQRIVGFQEKDRSGPGWINGGVYAIDTDIHWPAHLTERFSFEKNFLIKELPQLAPMAYRVEGFFLDIGVPEDLDRAQIELAGAAV